jgi:hypothetical protein
MSERLLVSQKDLCFVECLNRRIGGITNVNILKVESFPCYQSENPSVQSVSLNVVHIKITEKNRESLIRISGSDRDSISVLRNKSQTCLYRDKLLRFWTCEASDVQRWQRLLPVYRYRLVDKTCS